MSMQPLRKEEWYRQEEIFENGRKREPEIVPSRKKKAGIDNKDKIGMMKTLLVLGCFALVITLFSATTAVLKYNINQLETQQVELSKELNNVQIQIDTACNVVKVERTARKMGMVYPNNDQVVYLGDKAPGNFATTIMEQAYN